MNYAAAYPLEIEAAIADSRAGPEDLRRLLPGLATLSNVRATATPRTDRVTFYSSAL